MTYTRLREVARDLALLFVSAAVAAFLAAGAPLSLALVPVLLKAGLTAVAAQVVLLLTPLTKRYGIFVEQRAERLKGVPV